MCHLDLIFMHPQETLELYFQTCSILSTCDAMGIMSATLANGGFCPLTGALAFNRYPLPLLNSPHLHTEVH